MNPIDRELRSEGVVKTFQPLILPLTSSDDTRQHWFEADMYIWGLRGRVGECSQG